jgi:plasmid stabilization system protein ParE
MKPVELLPTARSDFDESFDWYAHRSPEAAERFERAVERALRQIADKPERFVMVDRIHRGCPLERFPFRLIYRIELDRVLVVAIAHAKRRPDFWPRRT